MATVVVFYMIVGMPEGPFPVQIGLGESVGSLQIAIKDINSNVKNIDIDKLQLFLAKTKGGEWLSADDEAVTSLLSGDTPELVKKLMNKEMAPTDPVKDFFEDAPTTRTIHVLVKVKESLPVFRPWTLANAKFSPLSTNSSSPVLHIPKAYAKGSGLRVGKDELLLYRRKEVIDEWEALDAAVVETYAQLWIVGPPRTGKSCAAFAFACSLKRVDDKLGETKDVLWISCSKGSDPELKCILFVGRTRSKRVRYFQVICRLCWEHYKKKRSFFSMDIQMHLVGVVCWVHVYIGATRTKFSVVLWSLLQWYR
ncbi:hypothetical protein P3T76_006404 [Phytophthora citrophthora]|uniref:Crinkler effector protein N-terminal domain-containing protein n=1 Tax=Phytophthora citrophthora TaxID=4793 RepID=A0AAD9LNS1_9STRA|nr:hypothetical protein P3T76_006404 [Phytophthora citrophthora]